MGGVLGSAEVRKTVPMIRHQLSKAFLSGVLVCALLVVGCAAPSPRPQITRRPAADQSMSNPAHRPTTTTEQSSTASTPRPSPSPTSDRIQLDKATSVRLPSWKSASLTAKYCYVAGKVRFQNGLAKAISKRYKQVTLGLSQVRYGTFSKSVGEVAAVWTYCNNGGMTAGGDLAYGVVLVGLADGRLYSYGELTARVDDGERPSGIGRVRFRNGKIIVSEWFYRKEDVNCCPSGRATTVWKLVADELEPSAPRRTG